MNFLRIHNKVQGLTPLTTKSHGNDSPSCSFGLLPHDGSPPKLSKRNRRQLMEMGSTLACL
jgi:hypothetical protein